jgi:hypothetical protein
MILSGQLTTVRADSHITVLLEPVWICGKPYYERVSDVGLWTKTLGYMTERSSALSLAFQVRWLGSALRLALHPRVPFGMCQRYFNKVWLPFMHSYTDTTVYEIKLKALARGIVLPDFKKKDNYLFLGLDRTHLSNAATISRSRASTAFSLNSILFCANVYMFVYYR